MIIAVSTSKFEAAKRSSPDYMLSKLSDLARLMQQCPCIQGNTDISVTNRIIYSSPECGHVSTVCLVGFSKYRVMGTLGPSTKEQHSQDKLKYEFRITSHARVYFITQYI